MRAPFLLAVALLGFGVAGFSFSLTLAQTAPPASTLRPAQSFAGITDARARSVALFEETAKVLTHPRCMNCHPATERPRQGDARRLHQPLVVRGADGHGAAGLQCSTCHHKENFDPARIPGDGHWALAPASMAWEGKSIGAICEQLKDRTRNGGRDIAAILSHVTSDTLVLWAWAPGPGRQPAPGTNAGFGDLLRGWSETGAHCPPA